MGAKAWTLGLPRVSQGCWSNFLGGRVSPWLPGTDVSELCQVPALGVAASVHVKEFQAPLQVI